METKRRISRADQAEQRKKELIKVGLRLFSENGYDATSIRDIAKGAGVTEGLIYHYFRGKKDLLKEIVECSVLDDPLDRYLKTAEHLPLGEVFSRIGRDILESLRKKKEIFRLMLAEARLFEKDADYFIPKLIYQNNMSRLGVFLKSRMKRGEIREMEPIILARQFTGSLVAFFIFQEILLGKVVTDVPAELFIKNLVDVFLNGIECEAGAR
jgi:AcrR family transcriptional regulator